MLALLLGAGSGVNPSQGIPGPFSFKRLQIWITDALVERAAHQSEFTHQPKSLSPSLNLFQLTSVHIAPANKPCAAVRLHVPDGCNNHPSDEKHVASLVLGYLTVGDHAIENNFWIIDAICYLPHDLPCEGCFAANWVRLVPLADASLTN